MREDVSFEAILRQVAGLIQDARQSVLAYTLVVGGLTALGVWLGLTETAAGTVSMGFSIDSEDTSASALYDLAIALVSLFGTFFLLKRYLAVRGRLNGDSLRLLPYLGLLIVSTLGITGGIILLVVPGVILLVRWSASSGYLIGGGHGVIESLSASWRATKGHGLPIFFAGMALLFGLLLVGAIVAMLAVFSASLANLFSAFLEALSGAVFAAFGIAVYCLVEDSSSELDKVFA